MQPANDFIKKAINPSKEGKHDLIKHIVGTANTECGFIIFGIDEDTASGIPTNLEGIDPSLSQKADE